MIWMTSNRYPWHDIRYSYNPAIHRTKQALFHSAVMQDLASNPLPPPHPELLKYFEPPKKVLKRAREALAECKAAFDVKEGMSRARGSSRKGTDVHKLPLVPKKVVRQRKDGHVVARDDDDEPLLLESPKRTQQRTQMTQAKKDAEAKAATSDTEDESDTEQLSSKKHKNEHGALPTPARSVSSMDIDPGRAPGRIIGTTYPLQDFRKNISQGDVVSKAVEDLGVVIKEIVMKPFTSRRNDELLECMTTFRDVALKVEC